MGNAASSIGGTTPVVRVLRRDGRPLDFTSDLAVSELLLVYPKYFVCHAQIRSDGQMIMGAVLDSKAMLRCGQVYLLLPMPGKQQQQHKPNGQASVHKAPKIQPVNSSAAPADHQPRHVKTASTSKSDQTPPRQIKNGNTTKPVISKQQLAKILADGTLKIATKSGPARLNASQIDKLLNQYPDRIVVESKGDWLPKLESIPEAPVTAPVTAQVPSN